jgi:hypothetical protein
MPPKRAAGEVAGQHDHPVAQQRRDARKPFQGQRYVQQERDRDREPGRGRAEKQFATAGSDLFVRNSNDPLEDLVGREAIANDRPDRRRTTAGALGRFTDRLLRIPLVGSKHCQPLFRGKTKQLASRTG